MMNRKYWETWVIQVLWSLQTSTWTAKYIHRPDEHLISSFHHWKRIRLARQGGSWANPIGVDPTSRQEKATQRISARLRPYRVQSSSIYFPKAKNTSRTVGRVKTHPKSMVLDKCNRGAAQNSANTDPRTSKMTPRLNHIMIFEKQSRFAKWYPTAKVTVLISSHFLVVRIFASSNFNQRFLEIYGRFRPETRWGTTSSQDEQKILSDLDDSSPLKPSNTNLNSKVDSQTWPENPFTFNSSV